jgi:hypothetical protein
MASRMRTGKGYELTVIGMLVDAGFDVYMPTVDDQGIDAIIRMPCEQSSWKYHEVQVKGSQVWNGIRCRTDSLCPTSILIFYCAAERSILWLLFDDVQRRFPLEAAVHGAQWGNVFLTSPVVRELQESGHADLAGLRAALTRPA